MAYSRTVATKNLGLDAQYDQCNSGKVKIYSGTVPATADTALSGNTLLAQPSFGATAFAAASGGVKTANTISPDTDAAATGTATFYRLTKSDGTVVSQGTVGTSGSNINLSSTSIVQHTTVAVFGLSFTAGG